MEVCIAKNSGFCFGVKRAVAMAAQAAEQGRVYSLGPLIHNPRETERLSPLVCVIDTLAELAADSRTKLASRVVIRSHGVGPGVYEQARQMGFEIIDATCPFVAKVQKAAKELYLAGYQVVIVGDHNHPEIIGIKSWTDNTAWVVADAAEVAGLPDAARIGVVAQTTQTQANFADVLSVLQARYPEVCFRNTICRATQERQEAAANLAGGVELMVVIGGKNSANTKKLLQICRDSGTPSVLIEGAEELSCDMFEGIQRVGVCAGASTPDWIIEEVVKFMTDSKDVIETKNEAAAQPVAKRNFAAEMSFLPGMVTSLSQPLKAEAAKPEAGKPAKKETPRKPAKPVEEMTEAELMESLYDKYSMPDLSRGSHIVGTVVEVKNGELLMDIGGKSLAVLPVDQLISKEADHIRDFKVGDKFEVAVLRGENRDGFTTISKRVVDRDRIFNDVVAASENDGRVEGRIVGVSDRGVVMDVGVTGFIPISHIDTAFVSDTSKYMGKQMTAKVLRVDKEKNRVYFSSRAVKAEEIDAKREALWESIEEGQVRCGIVARLMPYGAFIDLGGHNALLHRTNFSWYPGETIEKMLKVGDEVEVVVLSLDKEKGRIAVGMKQMKRNPWDEAAEAYPVGTVVKGTVQKIVDYGAFVNIAPAVNGLVHISQVSDRFVKNIHDQLKIGQEVEAIVIGISPEDRRIALSIRELEQQRKQEAAAAAAEAAVEEAPVEETVAEAAAEEAPVDDTAAEAAVEEAPVEEAAAE